MDIIQTRLRSTGIYRRDKVTVKALVLIFLTHTHLKISTTSCRVGHVHTLNLKLSSIIKVFRTESIFLHPSKREQRTRTAHRQRGRTAEPLQEATVPNARRNQSVRQPRELPPVERSKAGNERGGRETERWRRQALQEQTAPLSAGETLLALDAFLGLDGSSIFIFCFQEVRGSQKTPRCLTAPFCPVL